MEPSSSPPEAQPRPEADGPAPAAAPLLAPVADPERLPALDTLRGEASPRGKVMLTVGSA